MVCYNTVSGNSQKLAQGIYDRLESADATILPMAEAKKRLDEFDVIIAGYWVDKAGPNKEAAKFLSKVKNKDVFIFATMGFFPDSEQGQKAINRGVACVEKDNHIIGSFICSGAISEKVAAFFRMNAKLPLPILKNHAMTPEKEIEFDVLSAHPTETDIMLAAERVRERLTILKRIRALS